MRLRLVGLLALALLLVGVWSSSQTAMAAQPEWVTIQACGVSWVSPNGDDHNLVFYENVEIEFRTHQGHIDQMRLPDRSSVIPIGSDTIALAWCMPDKH